MQINKLTNANVYLDGVSRFGVVKELEIPQLKAATVDHDSLGMIQKIDFPVGFEKMEAKMTWNGPTVVDLAIASNIQSKCFLQFRGVVKQDTPLGITDIPLIVNLTGWFDGTPGINQQTMQASDLMSNFHVRSYQLIQNAIEVIYLNSITQEYRVMGVDKTAVQRAILGV